MASSSSQGSWTKFMNLFSNKFSNLRKTSSLDEEVPFKFLMCSREARRFYDMAMGMKIIAETKGELNANEKFLFSMGFKYMIDSRKRSLKNLDRYGEPKTQAKRVMITEYKDKIKAEIDEICNMILNILNDHLIPNCKDDVESVVYYTRILADYYRYLGRYAKGGDTIVLKNKALTAYKKAYQMAQKDLHPTNCTRLGIALNYSVFYHAILNDAYISCQIAQQAVCDAQIPNTTLSPEAEHILEKLRENLMYLRTASWVQTGEIPPPN